MLIRTQAQQEELHTIRHKVCALCSRDLDYPRIVADDAARTSYHVACAARLVGEIAADIQALLADPNAAELVKRIEVTNLMQQGKLHA